MVSQPTASNGHRPQWVEVVDEVTASGIPEGALAIGWAFLLGMTLISRHPEWGHAMLRSMRASMQQDSSGEELDKAMQANTDRIAEAYPLEEFDD